MGMSASDAVRADKFFWSVRLFKTRSLAAQACQGGTVKVNGKSIKPAYPIRVGDQVTANRGGWTKTLKVVALLNKRVGAQRVSEFVEEITPESERAKAREKRKERLTAPGVPIPHPTRQGNRRPTKRDRRQLESWFRMRVNSDSRED